jgi:PIN domain nuclease of toxin-antitoxin system
MAAAWRAADSPERETAILIDTHAWIWTLEQTSGKMHRAASTLVDRAAAGRRLFVSDFSFWEAGILARKSRLPVGTDAMLWLRRAAKAPGIVTVPVARDALILSTQLPGKPPKDPADCILIAQAQTLGASLLTCDQAIIAYAARTPGIPVCDARA